MKRAIHCTLNGVSGMLVNAPGLRVHPIVVMVTIYRDGRAVDLGGRMPSLAVLAVSPSGEPMSTTLFSLS